MLLFVLYTPEVKKAEVLLVFPNLHLLILEILVLIPPCTFRYGIAMLWYLEEQEIQALLGFNLFPFWAGILPVAVAPSTSLFSKAVYVPFLSSMQLQF